MAIREVRLQNFQKHKSLRVKFAPGLNLIVGASDQGKSAVFRALKWLAMHGSSTSLTTHGETSMQVGANIDGTVVTRFKTGKKNGYKAKDEEFVAVGKDQPDEIRQLVKLTDINFQAQHDPPFLLGMTPGQIAREVNKIVDLQAIDTIMAKVKSKVTANRSVMNAVEPRIEAAKETRDSLEWVKDARKDWDVLVSMESDLKAGSDRIESVTGTIEDIQTLTETIEYLQSTYTAASEDYTLLQQSAELDSSLRSKIDALSSRCDAIENVPDVDAMKEVYSALEGVVEAEKGMLRLTTSRSDLREYIKSLTRIANEKAEINEVGKALAAVNKIHKKFTELSEGVSELRRIVEAVTGLDDSRPGLVQELKDLEEKAKICPTCKKPL